MPTPIWASTAKDAYAEEASASKDGRKPIVLPGRHKFLKACGQKGITDKGVEFDPFEFWMGYFF